jgi:hypothetical protein
MRGKTFVSAVAKKPDKSLETEAQRKTRSTFREATQWAQAVLLDQEKKEYYRKRAKALKLPNAYTAAITDYMRKPKLVMNASKKKPVIMIRKPGFALASVTVKDKPASTRVIRKENNSWIIQWVRYDDGPPVMEIEMVDNFGRTFVETIFY